MSDHDRHHDVPYKNTLDGRTAAVGHAVGITIQQIFKHDELALFQLLLITIFGKLNLPLAGISTRRIIGHLASLFSICSPLVPFFSLSFRLT